MMKHLPLIIIGVLAALLFVSECSRETKVETVTVTIIDTVDRIELVDVVSIDTTFITKVDSFVRVYKDSVIIPQFIYDTIRETIIDHSEERLFESIFNDTNYTLIVSSMIQYNTLQNQWVNLNITTPIPSKPKVYVGGSFNGSLSGDVLLTHKRIGVGYGYDPWGDIHKVSVLYRLK